MRADICRYAAVALVASLGGCASSNYKGIADTGGRALAVAPEVARVPDVRVTELRDDSGSLVGTQETVTGYHSVTSGYSLKLGEDLVDEQDFYHLAHDRNGEDAVASARTKGLLMNRVGLGIMIASAATAIAVPILTDRTMAKYSVGQAFITAPIGLGLTLFGKRRVEQKQFSAAHAFGSIQTEPPAWATQLDQR
jgi:hypothetical protein